MSEWIEITLDNCIRFLPLLLIGILFLTKKASNFVSHKYKNQHSLLKIIGYHLIVLAVTFFLLIESYYYFRIFLDTRIFLFIGLLPILVIVLAISFHFFTKRLRNK